MKKIALVLAALALQGCHGLRRDSLAPGVERNCTGNRCYLIGTAEQIDRQCRKEFKKGGTWDDGRPMGPNDGRRAQCCTKYDPDRIRVWMARGEEYCVVHEECHIEEYETGRGEHWRCEGFGSRKEHHLESYIERAKR